MGTIADNVKQLLAEIPAGVQVVAAAKTRTPQEIQEALDAGITVIGENYVQEAETAYAALGAKAQWHFIGHLQKNKVKKAVAVCDMIETVDSLDIAAEIDRRCAQIGKTMPVLIEVNSGREPQKAGVYPENARKLIEEITPLNHVRVVGLMTMGPLTGGPEDYRPYFKATKKLFDELKQAHIPGAEMKYLSMGMTGSYKIALEEGANIIRIGSLIFGGRPSKNPAPERNSSPLTGEVR
jgi:pyridoxal phosphate enzyme (YggS family)